MVPGLPIVGQGWGDHCTKFSGSGAVVFWGYWVRCGRVKLVSSSLGSILGVIAELRMPTHKGEGTRLPILLSDWGDPCTNFLGSGAVVFWGFWVQCGGVKVVSKSLGSVWGIIAELRVPTYKGDGTRAIRIHTGLVRSLRKFLGGPVR